MIEFEGGLNWVDYLFFVVSLILLYIAIRDTIEGYQERRRKRQNEWEKTVGRTHEQEKED